MSQEDEDKASGSKSEEEPLECSVCLQSCVLPTRIPDCKHTFCFLCLKGAASRSGRCPLCRSPIPRALLLSPDVLAGAVEAGDAEGRGYWYYQGANGWWQYEPRTAAELEKAFTAGKAGLELLIAGHMYKIDFRRMLQHRRDSPSRLRAVRRETDPTQLILKGIAGVPKKNLSNELSEETSVTDGLTNLKLDDA